jgi:hypothetical protein
MKLHFRKLLIYFIIISLALGVVLLAYLGWESLNIDWYSDNKAEVFTRKMTLEFEQSLNPQLSEIFDFSFTYAYSIEDSYIDGPFINKEHGTDMDLDAVKSVEIDGIRRIVFFDSQGRMIYEYRYKLWVFVPMNEGLILFPDTVLSAQPIPNEENAFSIHFTGHTATVEEYFGIS